MPDNLNVLRLEATQPSKSLDFGGLCEKDFGCWEFWSFRSGFCERLQEVVLRGTWLIWLTNTGWRLIPNSKHESHTAWQVAR